MTLQEQIKALPEAERVKFFQGIMAVVDAGRKAGVPPEELAKMYAATYKQINETLKAREA
jgi:N-acetyl-gamma-glutamylphosphate reductase